MGLRDKIAIIGAGCTMFGENFHLDYSDMMVEAAAEALEEAHLTGRDIQAAWLGTAFPDAGVWKGRSGMDLAQSLGIFDIPITRVSNYCATGGDAFRNACYCLLSGEADVVMAMGVEKLRDRPPQESLVRMMVENGHPIIQKGFTAAGTFAVTITRHMHEFGTKAEHLGMISVKNHRHAINNPKAQYRQEFSLEQVMNSPMVAWPLTVLMSCPTTDGAACVVMTRTEDAAKFNKDYVLVKGHGFSVSTGWDLPFYDPHHEFTGYRATRVAATKAYRDAGISNPMKELDVAEVHDCFASVELVTYEDLGLCARGEGKRLVEEGVTSAGGELPVNLSGGLLSCGHPVGATGLRMLYELTRQLQGRAGKRQVPDARLGLAHNIGGPGAVASVTILGAR
ncbi:MAG: acetyl-CoA acetyltransferase [Thermoplasmata archaeon]